MGACPGEYVSALAATKGIMAIGLSTPSEFSPGKILPLAASASNVAPASKVETAPHGMLGKNLAEVLAPGFSTVTRGSRPGLGASGGFRF